MTRFVLILVAIMAVAVLGCAQPAPKDHPQKPEQKEPETPPEPTELAAQIEKLIVQLGDDDIEKRDAAQAELIEIGKPALAQLDKAIKETDDLEVQCRATAIAEELRLFTLIGKNDQGYEEYRHEKIGMVFVKIPGGTFKMGSDSGGSDEKPVHEVKLNGFMISKHEVTQAVWQRVMGKNVSYSKGEDNPVDQMSWNDCQEFCNKTGLRLPTEAEWEYACRAGTTTKYYWGDEPDGDYMWYSKNSDNKTHPVGQKKPNGYGLYDMTGNVREWCGDWWYAPDDGEDAHNNPRNPAEWLARVVRGGAWDDNVTDCRSAQRMCLEPDDISCNVGFRVVVDLPR